MRTSALTGDGIAELRAAIVGVVAGAEGGLREAGMLTNLRQHQAVEQALRGLDAAQIAVVAGIPHEMLLLDLYDALFSSGMKNKWDQRVYIDLYAGAGFSHIQGTSTFLKGSPIIALTVDCPFDRYIFCEENEELLADAGGASARVRDLERKLASEQDILKQPELRRQLAMARISGGAK